MTFDGVPLMLAGQLEDWAEAEEARSLWIQRGENLLVAGREKIGEFHWNWFSREGGETPQLYSFYGAFTHGCALYLWCLHRDITHRPIRVYENHDIKSALRFLPFTERLIKTELDGEAVIRDHFQEGFGGEPIGQVRGY